MQVTVDEEVEAGEGERLVGEVEAHEWRAERVEALPVDERRRALRASDERRVVGRAVRVRAQPGFDHALHLRVPERRAQQLVVLVAARHVNIDLPVAAHHRVLVERAVPRLRVALFTVVYSTHIL